MIIFSGSISLFGGRGGISQQIQSIESSFIQFQTQVYSRLDSNVLPNFKIMFPKMSYL